MTVPPVLRRAMNFTEIPISTLVVFGFIGFSALTLAVLVLQHRIPYSRQSYLVLFFSLLLLFNMIPGAPPPFTDLHKFTRAGPSESDVYQMYVTDESGRHLRFDRRAVPTMSPPTAWPRKLIKGCSDRARTQIGQYLLYRAVHYRNKIEQSTVRLDSVFDYPRHHLDYKWTKKKLAGLGPFEELRIYRIRFRFQEKSYRVVSKNRTRQFTVTLSNTTASPTLTELDRCL